jgi:hypothetical protein
MALFFNENDKRIYKKNSTLTMQVSQKRKVGQSLWEYADKLYINDRINRVLERC